MTSNQAKHIEASSTDPPGGDTTKPRALRNPSADQSDSAGMKKTALSDLSEILMEQIVDEQNVEQAWRKVKANQGAAGPDGITLDGFPPSFRSQCQSVQSTLTNLHLSTTGLVSLLEVWSKLAPKR